MSENKVVAMLMTKNENKMILSEDEDFVPSHRMTMIEQWLFDIQRYVDAIVVVYNAKDNHNRYEKSDGTYEILKAAKSRGKVVDIFKNSIEDLSFDGARDREKLWNMAKHYMGNDENFWGYTLDADELAFDSMIDVFPELMKDDKVNLWAFKEINLWRSRSQYRTDKWNISYFPRLFRNMDGIKLWSEFNAQALHESRIPQIPGGQHNVGEDITGVLHYAWVSWESRVGKTNRYIKQEVDTGIRTYEDAVKIYDPDTNEEGLQRAKVLKSWKSYEFGDLGEDWPA